MSSVLAAGIVAAMTSRHSRLGAMLTALVLLALLPLATPSPAGARRLGPGRVAVPGFSGYVTRGGGELGVGRLGNGVVGLCLDTGPTLRWPHGTPRPHGLLAPRAAYLAATYLPRAEHDPRIAAALWWSIGGSLRLNSHPARVDRHVAALRAEAPGVYAAVLTWHDRMLADARRNAPGRHGYVTALRTSRVGATTARVSGIGVRSAGRRWIAGHTVRLTITGGHFADGRTTWSGASRSTPRTVTVRTTPGRVVRVREAVTGLASPRLRVYDAGGTTQRIATAAIPVGVTATAQLAPATPPLRLRVVKTSEGQDPAGLIGVGVEIRAGAPTGPVVGRHTFTAADVRAGAATYVMMVAQDRWRRYVATVTREPAGWLPEAASVPFIGSGGTLTARLADDRIWQPTLATQISAQIVRPGDTVRDRVTVGDTGGDTLTGGWRLLGPLAPGPAGCRGLNWSRANVTAWGTFTVTGDGGYEVGAHRVRHVGCYTYVESLSGNRTTTPVAWTAPGAVAETTLVRSAPRLATVVSRPRVQTGATIDDRVRVSGVGEGSTAIVGQWQLLGPLAPNHRLQCTGLSWSGAPVAAHGAFSVRRDGSLSVGRHRVRAGGCYTYRERLRAGATSSGLAWTRPGMASETVVVTPRTPVVPVRPVVPAGGGRPASRLGGDRGSVRLAATRMRADLHPVTFTGRALVPPADIRTGGVWVGGAGLDAVVGTTVLVGHVSDRHDRPGAFHRLWGARRGQTITTVTPGGVPTSWRVTGVRLTAKRQVPRALFGQGLVRRLVLITCGNEVRGTDGRFHYRSNLIVTAVPR